MSASRSPVEPNTPTALCARLTIAPALTEAASGGALRGRIGALREARGESQRSAQERGRADR